MRGRLPVLRYDVRIQNARAAHNIILTSHFRLSSRCSITTSVKDSGNSMKVHLLVSLALQLFFCSVQNAHAQLEFEKAPINYHTAPVNDRLSNLILRIESGEAELQWSETHGWLPSLLKTLDVPRASQVLVFSKTSLQLNRISPLRPRALYFNDDTYIGWVQRGDVIEVSTVDPTQGTIFHTLSQRESERPEFRRDKGNCLVCHASTRTKGVPGLLVRSVYPSRNGQPHFGLGTITTDHRTPFNERFGGWYVTGQHGAMRHRGNAIASDSSSQPIDPEPGANRNDLNGLIRTSPYLESTSDLVALMLLEYQSQAHNALTRASFETRQAIHYDSIMNKALDRPAEFRSDVTDRRIRSAGDQLVRFLFYSGETRLTSAIRGSSGFADEFQKRGLRDSKERSLRDLDLQTRMFRYPLSYLIYSDSFDALPEPVRDHVDARMAGILTGQDVSPEFAHVSGEERQAILEIVRETKPGLWKRLVSVPER